MSDYATESEIARITRDAAAWSLGGNASAADSSRMFLGRVTTLSPALNQFINMIPQVVLGVDSEGATGTMSDTSSTPTSVLLEGTVVPATGDYLIARRAGNRWVTRKRVANSGGGPPNITPTGCFCTALPQTLHLTIVAPTHTDTATLTWDAPNNRWLGCAYTPGIASCLAGGECYTIYILTCISAFACQFQLVLGSMNNSTCTVGSGNSLGTFTLTGTCGTGMLNVSGTSGSGVTTATVTS